MKNKKILISLLITSSLFANDPFAIKQDFDYPHKDFYQVKQFIKDGGKIDFDLANKLNSDLNWLKANNFLRNDTYRKDITSDIIKNHGPEQDGYKGTNLSLELYKMSRKVIGNYTTTKSKEALIEFDKSLKLNKNVLSAYQGLTIIYDYYPKNNEIIDKYKYKFAESLMKNQICLGYLSLGQMYKDGQTVSKNYQKSFEIFEKGKSICKKLKDTPSSWQYKHLLSNYYFTKRFK